MVERYREATDSIIAINPQDVNFFVGNELKTEEVRLSHEGASVPANKTTPTGLGTSFSMYLVARWDSAITENSVIIENGRGWKVGPVDEPKVCGECYRKRAPLTAVALGSSAAINSAKIGTVVGVINAGAHTITFALPLGTVITALSPTFSHNGKMVSPVTVQNFTTPKTYQVVAENLSIQNYTVTVVLA